jgi:hypothetical protein
VLNLWVIESQTTRLHFGGVYWSVIGHRLRVAAMGLEGQGAVVVQGVWMGVKM